MFVPFPLTHKVISQLHDNLQNTSAELKRIKQMLVQSQKFENASMIREVEKAIENLMEKMKPIMNS
jgi:excinuclease UvrABC nuclease subunit